MLECLHAVLRAKFTYWLPGATLPSARSQNRHLRRCDCRTKFLARIFLSVDALSDGVSVEQDFKRTLSNNDEQNYFRRSKPWCTNTTRSSLRFDLFLIAFFNSFPIDGTARGFEVRERERERGHRPMCLLERYFSWIWNGKRNGDTCVYFPRKSRTRVRRVSTRRSLGSSFETRSSVRWWKYVIPVNRDSSNLRTDKGEKRIFASEFHFILFLISFLRRVNEKEGGVPRRMMCTCAFAFQCSIIRYCILHVR